LANGIGSDVAAINDGLVIALAAGAHYEIARYTREKAGDAWTWKRSALNGEHAKNIEGFEVSEDGKTIVYHSSTGKQAFTNLSRAN